MVNKRLLESISELCNNLENQIIFKLFDPPFDTLIVYYKQDFK